MLNLRGAVRSRFAAVAALSLLLASGLTACKADSNYFTAANASVGSGDGAAADATSGFRIRIKQKTGVDAFLHKFGDIAAGCEIPLANVNTPTSIRCMLNMMEYDMWFYGFEYEVTVPTNYCTYLYETPYRYYKAEPGFGPATARIEVTDGTVTLCRLDNAAGTINGDGTTCSNAEVTYNASGGVSSCAYNYTGQSGTTSAAPNCCDGAADVTLKTTTNGVSSTVSTRVPYGGSYLNCKESPNDFVSDWPKTDKSQATDLVTALGSGSLVKTTKIPSPMTLNTAGTRVHTGANFLNAGFHGWDNYAANPATWASTVTVPRAIRPLVDRGIANTRVGTGATDIPKPVDGRDDGSMVFDCLGPAGELKQRIQVYANTWNTIEDYTAFKANGNPAAVTPNRTGTAGVDCLAINGTTSCNTIWGFDDMIKSTYAYKDLFGVIHTWGGNGDPAAYVFPREFDIYTPDPF